MLRNPLACVLSSGAAYKEIDNPWFWEFHKIESSLYKSVILLLFVAGRGISKTGTYQSHHCDHIVGTLSTKKTLVTYKDIIHITIITILAGQCQNHRSQKLLSKFFWCCCTNKRTHLTIGMWLCNKSLISVWTYAIAVSNTSVNSHTLQLISCFKVSSWTDTNNSADENYNSVSFWCKRKIASGAKCRSCITTNELWKMLALVVLRVIPKLLKIR